MSQLTCRVCRSPLLGDETLVTCSRGCERIERVGGVWRALPAGERERLSRFLHEYSTVRRAEGRRFDARAYGSLPYGVKGERAAEWWIRAKSYEAFVRELVEPLRRALGRPLRIIDLGAGNGWLSNRLSSFDLPVSVDVSVDEEDGLGAPLSFERAGQAGSPFTAIPFERLLRIPRVEASADELPFADDAFDLAVFNASFHYSESYERTLKEALRVAPEVVVMDTPVYRDGRSGARMVLERETEFTRLHGFPSNAITGEGYLTFDRIRSLARDLTVVAERIRPVYDLRFTSRPLTARLAIGREPARFFVLCFRRPAGHRSARATGLENRFVERLA
ncbi:MAG: class I SAM-dependent methyltransferase [Deltaproteobacteria bacterium]|nr:class I SAM-dependent methyltransferase [Deltaproteobacteria bacterium]